MLKTYYNCNDMHVAAVSRVYMYVNDKLPDNTTKNYEITALLTHYNFGRRYFQTFISYNTMLGTILIAEL